MPIRKVNTDCHLKRMAAKGGLSSTAPTLVPTPLPPGRRDPADRLHYCYVGVQVAVVLFLAVFGVDVDTAEAPDAADELAGH